MLKWGWRPYAFLRVFFTSSSSLIAESEETLVYLFILGRDVYLDICTCTGDVGFMILPFVCFMLEVTGRCSPPPPPTAPHTVCVNTRVLRFFILFYVGGRGGGCVVVLCTVYCRSQLVCPPPSPFSHYSQLLPFTVSVSPPSHFPLILPIPSFPSSNLLVYKVRSCFVTRGWKVGGDGGRGGVLTF